MSCYLLALSATELCYYVKPAKLGHAPLPSKRKLFRDLRKHDSFYNFQEYNFNVKDQNRICMSRNYPAGMKEPL
jgi:hypothetical protein